MDKSVVFKKIDSLREEMTKDLQSLIRCRSVLGEEKEGAPFGEGVAEAYDVMMRMARREGFETLDFDGYGGHIDFLAADENGAHADGAHADGAHADNIFGILCHLDVVAEGSGWTHEPYSAEIIDGTMYGRGTLDDKGPTIAAFYAMKALKDCGAVPAGRIRMIIGLDEETKSAGMEYYKAHVDRLPDKSIVPDSDFPLIQGEKGIMIFDIVKKIDTNQKTENVQEPEKVQKNENSRETENIQENENVQETEKVQTSLKMHLVDISGGNAANMVPDMACARLTVSHIPNVPCMPGVSSMPSMPGVSSMPSMTSMPSMPGMSSMQNIAAILSETADVCVENDEIIVKCYGKSAHGAMPWKGENAISKLIKTLGRVEFDNEEINAFIRFYNEKIGFDLRGEKLGLGSIKDDVSGELVWNTGMVKYIKNPEADDEIIITVNIRVPVTFSDSSVFDILEPCLAEAGAVIDNALYKPSLYYDSENEMVKLLLDVYRENTGDTKTEPLVIGGGTYAREIPNAIAFGALYPNDPDIMHEADECIKIDRLVQTAKIYADALLRLAILK